MTLHTNRRKTDSGLLVEPALTANRQRVLRTLQWAGASLRAYGIPARLQGEGVRAVLQVYRALERLIGFGLVMGSKA